MTRVRIQGKHTSPCAHPGCKKTIREGTSNWPTGRCIEHQIPPPPKPKREGVREVLVHLVPGCSTLAASHRVTMPKEPWL